MQWLLLLHNIPPKPAYFRAKVLRRLAEVGALPLKNAAYLLPDNEDTWEDFEWITREITQEGGSAWVFRAEALAGISAAQTEDSFRKLRSSDYKELIATARALLDHNGEEDSTAQHAKLAERFEQLKRIDFFGCPERRHLEDLMAEIKRRAPSAEGVASGPLSAGRVWVTRTGVKVDRIASAWLIRRFIDPQATFRFVAPDSYQHAPGEIRFDMFEGEFTHRGDMCTFEVLLAAHNLRERPGLAAIGEMVHDIDLKENRYQRPETPGFQRMLLGLCARTPGDEERIERGTVILESLHQSFSGA